MKRLFPVIAICSLTALLAGCATDPSSSPSVAAMPASAAATPPISNPLPILDIQPGTEGKDASYPQCGTATPDPGGFAIVGVNGELPTILNPCFDELVAWAARAEHPPLLYVNAANPAGLNTPTWPKTGGNDYYGACTGAADAACSYQYGVDRINGTGLVPADKGGTGDKQLINRLQRPTIVFIAIEKEFSWQDGAQTPQTRIATLEGMADAIRQGGNQPGIYATAEDWQLLMGGDIQPGQNLYGVPIWWRGAPSLDSSYCGRHSFTGGKILFVQAPALNTGSVIDENIAC